MADEPKTRLLSNREIAAAKHLFDRILEKECSGEDTSREGLLALWRKCVGEVTTVVPDKAPQNPFSRDLDDDVPF